MAVEVTSREGRNRPLPAMAAIQEHATEAAAFLKALANDQRLLMLCCLLEGSLSVGEINERVPLSQSALSQHLGVLRDAGLVTTTRQSQTIYYALAKGPALQDHGGSVYGVLRARGLEETRQEGEGRGAEEKLRKDAANGFLPRIGRGGRWRQLMEIMS